MLAKGIVFDIKRYCVHDGPGIRTTVFLKGCPLRCWWCHNPEGRKPDAQVFYRPSHCIRCGTCLTGCPNGAVYSNGKPVNIDPNKCKSCGACREVCPAGGIEMIGREYSVLELVDQVERDRIFYEESGGGVTFSGGEPLQQPHFLLESLRECKRRGIHTVVDTCGYAEPAIFEAIRPYVDLFLYDIKLMDHARHKRYTGVPNEPIIENLGRLAVAGSEVIVVLPLIPGVNDDDANIDELAEFVQDLGLGEISVLPFHHTGSSKLEMMGLDDPMRGVKEPGEHRLQEIQARLVLYGLNVRVGKR